MFQTSYHEILVFRTGSGKNDELFLNFLKFLKVGNFLFLLSVFNIFFESTAHFVELRAFFADVRVVQVGLRNDATLDGNSLGSIYIITSNHAYCNTSCLDLFDGAGDLTAYCVLNTKNSYKSETVLFNIFNGFVLGVIVFLSILSRGDIFVSDGNWSKSFSGIAFNQTLDHVQNSIILVLDLTSLIHIAGT